jgi:hypothetical protein
VLWTLIGLFRVKAPAAKIKALEESLEWTERAVQEITPVRLFCPIWVGERTGEPWLMTFNRETYAHDLLARCGGEGIFADRAGGILWSRPGLAEADDLASATSITRGDVDESVRCRSDLSQQSHEFGGAQVENPTEKLSDTPAVHSGRSIRSMEA